MTWKFANFLSVTVRIAAVCEDVSKV
jgi:hypothetical protein